MSNKESPIVTLLTDFGSADYFVSSLKGRILSINPRARIVDITHDIPPQDIEAAAFTLFAGCDVFPPGTIHVAVVDPGVGTSRKPIMIETSKMFFVGPDNGIFSYVCERYGPRKIIHLNNEKYFSPPVSPTFNGRDVFAPVAAALSNGVKPARLGTPISEMVQLPSLKPSTSLDGKLLARIIHIDRFGNCVTNITARELTAEMIAKGASLRVKGKKITSFRRYFAEETGDPSKVFAVWGSAGFLEIAAANDSAAKILNAKRGDAVTGSAGVPPATAPQARKA
jgi:S-adenosyl-L-methionine hydrolase (adenosine-forming)